MDKNLINKTDLYKLIDTLPESKIPVVRAYLKGVHDGAGPEDGRTTLDIFLDSVPYEDEEISEAEEAEARTAEEDIQKNGTVSHEEAMRFLAS